LLLLFFFFFFFFGLLLILLLLLRHELEDEERRRGEAQRRLEEAHQEAQRRLEEAQRRLGRRIEADVALIREIDNARRQRRAPPITLNLLDTFTEVAQGGAGTTEDVVWGSPWSDDETEGP
jgi:hypothetical protein